MSTVPASAPERTKRHARDLKGLARSPALSHFRRALEAVSQPNRPPESAFSPSAWLEWARNYLAYVFKSKHFFPGAQASPQGAVYDLGSGSVTVSIAGDWGTGTDEAQQVVGQMQKFGPHFTIHIGDVYYVGDVPSVNENCLGITNPNNNYTPVNWPIGTVGSFALNGNHEMYANGTGYFDVFLPRLGLQSPPGTMSGQQTSFFCLQNKHWCIVAIDTGYNSIGVPILSQIPWINEIPGIGGDCKLPKELMNWLTESIVPQINGRGLIIVSHHQYYSGFEARYTKPAKQLWKAGVRGPVLWFWGHEHRLAGYGLNGSDNLKAYGRCVGHGGMPVELGAPTKNPKPLFWDDRTDPNGFGVNGHVNLSFEDEDLTATYVDLNGNKLLSERWKVSSGAVRFIDMKKEINDPNFHVDGA